MTITEDGIVNWTPAASQFGDYTVAIAVSDGSVTSTQSFVLNVTNIATNTAPSITSVPNLITNSQRTYEYNLTGVDPDGDLLLWSLDTAPDGMIIDATTGALRLDPSSTQIGEHDVKVRLTDANGSFVGQEFTLTVTGINTPPAIVSNPVTSAALFCAYTYNVVATDPENDVLSFGLGRRPEGMTIDDNGLVSWIPIANQLGSQVVEVLVQDTQGSTTTQTYTINVGATAINHAPNITSTPVYLAAVGSAYSYQVVATDPDSDALTYQLLSVPAGVTGISIDPNTGLLSWATPIAGNYKIVVGAVDASGSGAAQGFTISARENHAPAIQSNPRLTATPGSVYAYDIIATDVDSDRLTYTLDQVSLNKGISIDTLGRLRWTPTTSNVGTHNIVLTVSDGNGGSQQQTYNLVVAGDTVAPKVSLIATYDTVNLGESVTFQARATDNVKVAGLQLLVNNQAVVLDANGLATFTPINAGTVTAKAIATDTAGNVGQATFDVFVRNPNDTNPPVVSFNLIGVTDGFVTAPSKIKPTITDDGQLDYYRLLVAPVNPINLPKGAAPRSIIIGSENDYAYIADAKQGKIYILDIDPFSETYHQVIKTITFESAPAGLRDMAISSDGRKLFVAAPSFPNSQIFVVNIDPEDEPLDLNQNLRKWHEQIGAIQTSSMTEGIEASSDPLKIVFTNSRNDAKGFGVIEITNNNPTEFTTASPRYAKLQLGSIFDYFDVNRAVAVTITHDGSYAFVAGRNDGPFGQDIPSVDGFAQAGSNIGIIKDPLGLNPQLIAATRPIPQGYISDLVLSGDGKSLYASYPTESGGGGVFVYDVEEIIRTLDNPGQFKIDELHRGIKSAYFNAATARNVNLSDFQSVPVDDINPGISIAADYGIVQGDWQADQFTYGVTDPKHTPIGTGGTPWGMASYLSTQQDNKEKLQDLSTRIAELVKMRDTTGDPDAVDEQLKKLSRKRDGLLRNISQEVQKDRYGDEVSLTEVILDGGRTIFQINYENLFQTFYGSSSVAWNIAPLDNRSVFDIGKDIASQPRQVNLPKDTSLTTMFGFGGTTAQGLVQPYPGDIDYLEVFDVAAQSSQKAAEAIFDTIVEFVGRNETNPRFEFEKIIIKSSTETGSLVYKSISELENNRSRILQALQGLKGENDYINTFWRARVDGDRFIGITKVLGISARHATTGEILFSTQPLSEDAEFLSVEEEASTTDLPFETRPGGAEFQTAFLFKQPETFPREKLGWYASTMREQALENGLTKGKYLKGAKRAFNYFMAIGNIEAMKAISPVFNTLQAQVNQQVSVMEAIFTTLESRGVHTRILKTYDAEAMLNNVANIIENLLPGVAEVDKTPTQIADELRDLALQLEEEPDGSLKQNDELLRDFKDLIDLTQETINQGIKETVQQVFTDYLVEYHQDINN